MLEMELRGRIVTVNLGMINGYHYHITIAVEIVKIVLFQFLM